MNEVFFPINHSEVPLINASRDPSVVVLLGFVMAPPEHVLSQTSLFPVLHEIYKIDYPEISLVTPGYYATGYELDARPVTVADGKLWFFSRSIYDQHEARLRAHGWRPSCQPELVLVAAQAAQGGGWNFGEEPVAIDLTAVQDQPVASFIGALLIALHKGPIAATLEESGSKLRELVAAASVVGAADMSVCTDLSVPA